MIEELIRVDHGIFSYGDTQYRMDLSIARGECIGIYVDNHRTSGSACMRIFTGGTRLIGGTAFAGGVRIGYQELDRWIRDNTMVIGRDRFPSSELTAGDYVCAIRKEASGMPGTRKRESVLLRAREGKLRTGEALDMRTDMGISFSWDTPLAALSMLDYYRLTVFQAWMAGQKILVLDRITEVLRRQDLNLFMDCILRVLGQGAAVFLLDMDENFMFRYASRIDVMKNRRLAWQLYPEEYGEKLYRILGWRRDRSKESGHFGKNLSPELWGDGPAVERTGTGQRADMPNDDFVQKRGIQTGEQPEIIRPSDRMELDRTKADRYEKGDDGKRRSVLAEVSDLTFPGIAPMNFCLDRGEIGILQDENYRTGSCIRDCFLGNGGSGRAAGWQSGTFRLDGRAYTHRQLRRMVGSRIAVQIEMPDRSGGVLFDNLTALENLSSSLIPKAGKHIIRRSFEDSILDKASEWFDREAVLRPISTWSMPERLRLSYYKWYLLNPGLLICLFPFLGQESIHHEMIMDLIVRCAKRGMGVWIISSGISEIREKSGSREFLERLRYLD